MPYFKNYKILFIHIPKTGGESVAEYFYKKYQLIRTMSTLNSSNAGRNFTYYGHSLQHLTYTEMYVNKDFFDIDFENLTIYTIVRNPYNRIVSDLLFYKFINEFSDPNFIENEIFKYLNSNDEYDNHKLPQYKFIFYCDKIIENIKIIRTESLTKDMNDLGFGDFENKKNVTLGRHDYINLLTKNSIEMINKYYQLDFEYFGYQVL